MMQWKRYAETPAFVREHFQKQAVSFDGLYEDDSLLQRTIRPGLFQRRKAAMDLVRRCDHPLVLDVGCGSGRVAESILEVGVKGYVGVDFSEPMLELAGQRLQRFGQLVTLRQGNFLELPFDTTFDVILGLGLFDYVEEPDRFTRRMRELSRGWVYATFPRWNWYKGVVRHIRYRVINRCPIYDYTERELRFLFKGSGFDDVQIDVRRNGFAVLAR
ncbi:MAG TPA: class I SAM-dependent methyltransferase [Polyangiaceae bacterium]|nr:class I SAM-dependent methyltransferase [Polyangiaceae bacterium]